MGNDIGTAQGVYVCTNNDAAGDGQPCFWFGRERRATVVAGSINIGQGLLIKAVLTCECGSYLHDQGVSVQEITG